MRTPALLLLSILAGTGCQAVQLQHRTVRQSGTLTDLHYQEVLKNLAMFAEQPDTLPFYALANKGITTVTNTGEATTGLNWDYAFLGTTGAFVNHFDKKSLTLRGSQQDTGTWNTDSILNPDKLYLMRCAYQKALGGCGGPDCDAHLTAFFRSDPKLMAALRPGWYGVGRLRDVPKGACHVARYGHTYAWVRAEGVNDLALFTLAILDIATASDTALLVVQPPPPQTGETAIKATIERIKALTDIYKQLPDTTPEEKLAKARFEVRLLAELAKLEVLYGGGSPAEKRKRYEERVEKVLRESRLFQMNLTDDEKGGLKKEFQREFDALVEPPAPPAAPPTPPGPLTRPRKEFNTFPVPPNVVPIT